MEGAKKKKGLRADGRSWCYYKRGGGKKEDFQLERRIEEERMNSVL